MSSGVLIWVILFGVFGIIFFSVAAVVSYKGIADIKELMNDPDLSEEND